MILLGGWIYEGLSTEVKPLPPVALNGQIFKELDTGESYHLRNGTWQYVNLGLSFIKATKSGRITTDAGGLYTVTFATPFINDQYTVALSCDDAGLGQPAIALFKNLTASGFTIQSRYSRTGNVRPSTVVSWLATRNYDPLPPL